MIAYPIGHSISIKARARGQGRIPGFYGAARPAGVAVLRVGDGPIAPPSSRPWADPGMRAAHGANTGAMTPGGRGAVRGATVVAVRFTPTDLDLYFDDRCRQGAHPDRVETLYPNSGSVLAVVDAPVLDEDLGIDDRLWQLSSRIVMDRIAGRTESHTEARAVNRRHRLRPPQP